MTKNENPVVLFENVFKSYIVKGFLKNKLNKALDNISFSISEGEIIGLFGLNGAGKTTIIKLICGLISPDNGRIKVFDSWLKFGDVDYKRHIGYLPELPYFNPFFKAIDTLSFYYSISGNAINTNNINNALKLVGLFERKDDRIKNFSKGMMQRLAISCSLVHDPRLLVYDEPTSGLDPLSIREIRNIMLGLKERGKTLLISSHSISEAEKICDRIIIIDRGRIKKIIFKKEWENLELEKIFIDAVLYEN